MAVKIPYVVERDGTYYYVRRVPKTVIDRPGAVERFFQGQRTVRVSLHTSNKRQAVELADERTRDFDKLVQLTLDQGAAHLPRKLRPVTPEVLQKLKMQRRSAIVAQFRQYRLMRELGGEAAEYVEDIIDRIEMDAEFICKVTAGNTKTDDPRFDFRKQADDIIEQESFDAPVGSDAYLDISITLKEGEVQGYRDGFDLLHGRKSISDLLRQDELPQPAPQSQRLSIAVEGYVSRQRNNRTVTGINEALRCFVGAIGDLHLHELQAEHFRKFCVVEAEQDVGGNAKGSVRRPMAAATIDKKLTFLRSAISHAINSGNFNGSNPVTGISAKHFARPNNPALMPDKRPFTVGEMNLVLAHPWFVGCKSASAIHRPGDHRLAGMWYWGSIVALLTGCRAGEIGGLALNEVRIDDPHPHIIIRDNQFRTTKTGYQRKVPIIDQLFDVGFADYIEAQRGAGATRLFDDWDAPTGFHDASAKPWSNGKMVRSFNTTLIPAALKDMLTDGARREVKFHSFRGAFKTLLTRQKYEIQTNYAHEVMGHSKSGLDKRYIGEIPIEETYPTVRACRYEGLIIPPPPRSN